MGGKPARRGGEREGETRSGILVVGRILFIFSKLFYVRFCFVSPVRWLGIVLREKHSCRGTDIGVLVTVSLFPGSDLIICEICDIELD